MILARQSTLQKPTNFGVIQDYFGQTIGGVKRAMLNYGPNGRSRGVATIIFRTGDSGSKAAKQLDGVKVDGKPMKVNQPKSTSLKSQITDHGNTDRSVARCEAGTYSCGAKDPR